MPEIGRINLFYHKSFVIPGQKKDFLRMFQFQSEKVLNILFGIISPIHIVSQEDNVIRFLKVSLDNLLTGLQISMGISHKNHFPPRGELDQPWFLLKYSFCLLKK